MDGFGACFNDIIRHIGQTVTIFTTSGGIAGGGFTGVLMSVDHNCVRLLVCEGAPPCCALGSACGVPNCCDGGGWDNYGGVGFNGGFNPMGGVVCIPMCSIAAFVHHAI